MTRAQTVFLAVLAGMTILAASAASAASARTLPRRASPAAGGGLRDGGGHKPGAAVIVDTREAEGTVSAAVLGDTYLWPLNGMESYDSRTGHFYPAFIRELRDVMRPGSLRYPGGVSAETFDWERAIGPQAKREPNAYGPVSGASPSTVGPDEFGELLDETGAVGVVTANFGTGTATEAADFVSYMTGKAGTSTWADLRARYGHRAPYDVAYWEVGNEEQENEYWRSGTPVTTGGPKGACGRVWTCQYIYGGSTRFAHQRVVEFASRLSTATYSTGLANQHLFVEYPPVSPGTATIYVGPTAWAQVDSLRAAGRSDHVYELVPSTGGIVFGNGVHGAIPPKRAKITASYVSGPHQGFLDFYRLMKKANPDVHVCSSDPTRDFYRSMGTKLPYDCIEFHPYVTNSLSNATPIARYEDVIMASPYVEAETIGGVGYVAGSYAGRRVPVVLSEYGQATDSNPDGYPYYHDSLDEALLNASQLAEWIRIGVPVADRQLLAGAAPPPSECCRNVLVAAPYVTTAAIETPGPDTILQPTGAVYNLFAPLGGGNLLPVAVAGNPSLTSVDRTPVPALSVLAVRSHSDVYLIVINRSTDRAFPTRVVIRGVATGDLASYTVLDGASSLSYNSLAAPDAVRFRSGSLSIHADAPYVRSLVVDVPAHSAMRVTVATHTPALIAPPGRWRPNR